MDFTDKNLWNFTRTTTRPACSARKTPVRKSQGEVSSQPSKNAPAPPRTASKPVSVSASEENTLRPDGEEEFDAGNIPEETMSNTMID